MNTPHMTTMKDSADDHFPGPAARHDGVLHCLRGLGTFHYLPNGGNLGDQAIAHATREFFHQHGLAHLPCPPEEGSGPVRLVYGGGGPFVPYHGMLPGLQRLFDEPNLERVVILPSSFYQCDELAGVLDERFTVFCREEQSRRYLEGLGTGAEILEEEDMALGLEARRMLESRPEDVFSRSEFRDRMELVEQCLHTAPDGKRVLLFLRTDGESRLDWRGMDRRSRICDLSALAQGTASDPERSRLLTYVLLAGLDQADVILTDRLHGAVCAALLGKETYVLDNVYGKVAGVHARSLRRYPGVTMLPSAEDFPYRDMILPPARRGTGGRGRKPARKRADILVGICSALKCRERRDAVRESWLRHPQEGVECLFFIGGKVPAQERGDTVGLDAPDTYNELPAKVLAFFRYALAHYDFRWLFKCDDDTYLDLARLPGLADESYGIVGDVSLEQRNAPSGGAGYLLRRDIVEKIAARPDVPLTGAEDLIYGKLALEAGAVPHATPMLYMADVCGPLPDNGMVSAHWCKPDTLRTMDVLRHGTPAAVYRGRHPYWTDCLLFYREGVFRRASRACYGWWSLDGDRLTLAWKEWEAEGLEWDGQAFQGGRLTLEREKGSRSLWELGPMGKEMEKCPI